MKLAGTCSFCEAELVFDQADVKPGMRCPECLRIGTIPLRPLKGDKPKPRPAAPPPPPSAKPKPKPKPVFGGDKPVTDRAEHPDAPTE